MKLSFVITVWQSYTEASGTLIESISKHTGFRFETNIDGGFGTASFTLAVTPQKALVWYNDYLGYHIVVFDYYGRRVYEGRIETVDVAAEGVTVNCSGYYSHANDLTFGMVYPTTTPKTATQIITDAINLTDQWTKDTTQLMNTVIDVTPQDFTGETKLSDAIDAVLKLGGDPDNNNLPFPFHFYIWENRIPYLQWEAPEGRRTINWYVSMQDVVGESTLALSKTKSEVFNRIQVLYDDPSIGATFTNWFEDLPSQQQYGIREGSVNIGQADSTVADLVGQLMIDSYAYPQQTSSISLQGMPMSAQRYRDFPYMIRAGEYVSVIDNEYLTVYVVADGSLTLSSYVVARTSYDADNNQLEIEFGKKSRAMDILLARIGMNSGSVR